MRTVLSSKPRPGTHLFVESVPVCPTLRAEVTPDTGSADLWVYGPAAQTIHSKFNIRASSTIATDATAAWRITYGSGSLSGYLARDTVSLAGLTFDQQIFALTNTTVPIFETLRESLALGLFSRASLY